MPYVHPGVPKSVADAGSLFEIKRPEFVVRRRNSEGPLQFHARSMVHQDTMEEAAGDNAITVLLHNLVLSDKRSRLTFVLGQGLETLDFSRGRNGQHIACLPGTLGACGILKAGTGDPRLDMVSSRCGSGLTW